MVDQHRRLTPLGQVEKARGSGTQGPEIGVAGALHVQAVQIHFRQVQHALQQLVQALGLAQDVLAHFFRHGGTLLTRGQQVCVTVNHGQWGADFVGRKRHELRLGAFELYLRRGVVQQHDSAQLGVFKRMDAHVQVALRQVRPGRHQIPVHMVLLVVAHTEHALGDGQRLGLRQLKIAPDMACHRDIALPILAGRQGDQLEPFVIAQYQ